MLINPRLTESLAYDITLWGNYRRMIIKQRQLNA